MHVSKRFEMHMGVLHLVFDIFVDQISVEARRAIHVGDDQKADKAGANAVGIDCWLVK